MTSLQCLKQASHELSLPLRYGNSTRNYVVRVGDYHTLVPEEFEEEIRVEQIVTHRLYRPHSNDYDIALVRLQGPEEQCARLSSHVLPACLPRWRERPQKRAHNCYVTGWGDTGNRKPKGTVKIRPPSCVWITHLGVQWVVVQSLSHVILSDPMDCSTPGFCSSPSPGVCLNSCPLSWRYHPTVIYSVAPFSSHLQSFPAPGSFPVSRLCISGQSVGASVSASVPHSVQWVATS